MQVSTLCMPLCLLAMLLAPHPSLATPHLDHEPLLHAEADPELVQMTVEGNGMVFLIAANASQHCMTHCTAQMFLTPCPASSAPSPPSERDENQNGPPLAAHESQEAFREEHSSSNSNSTWGGEPVSGPSPLAPQNTFKLHVTSKVFQPAEAGAEEGTQLQLVLTLSCSPECVPNHINWVLWRSGLCMKTKPTSFNAHNNDTAAAAPALEETATIYDYAVSSTQPGLYLINAGQPAIQIAEDFSQLNQGYHHHQQQQQEEEEEGGQCIRGAGLLLAECWTVKRVACGALLLFWLIACQVIWWQLTAKQVAQKRAELLREMEPLPCSDTLKTD